MVFIIKKLYLKISSLYKFIVTNILLIGIFNLSSVPVFSNDINTEINLAYKYCKSIESNMFKGLDDERILKYEYFFNSIKKEDPNEVEEILNNFTSEVKSICSYNLNDDEIGDFRKELMRYLSIN